MVSYKTLTLVALCALALPACTKREARIRVTAEVSGPTLNLSAVLEGADGQGLSGALVKLTDPSGAVSIVNFDARKNAYALTAPALNGEYRLEADSLGSGRQRLSFPVQVFSTEPGVVSVQDGEGSKAEEFKKLKAGTPIRVEWRPVEGAERYLLELRQGGKTVGSVRVSGGYSYVIPPNTFQGSAVGAAVTVQVTASAQSGDLDYSRGYLSYTSAQGPSYSFQVVP